MDKKIESIKNTGIYMMNISLKQIYKFQFAGKVEKKYCYSLEEFESLFYMDFSSKITIAVLGVIIIKIRDMLRNGSDGMFP